jgi:cobalt-zinc-cadmium efflux system membrane fusion protein
LRKKQAYERANTLFKGEVIAQREVENAQADYQQARAESIRAQQRLHHLQLSGVSANGHLLIKAPISGVIAERHLNAAQEVRPDLSDPLFVITDLTQLYVLVDLPEHHLGKIKVGQHAVLEVDALPNELFDTTIRHIGAVVDVSSRRIPVRAKVHNPKQQLRIEMYAKVTLLKDGQYNGVRLPNSAVVSEGVNTFVFVERQAGQFERVKVEPIVQDPQYVYLAQGVTEGERIVVSGALLLNAEMRITR